MSPISIPNKPSLIIKDNYDRKNKVYTLHNRNSNPFTMQFKRTENYYKTTMISFKQEEHAIVFGKMLESHKKLTNEWPSTIADSLNAFTFMAYDLSTDNVMELLHTNEWNYNDLRLHCVDKIMDLLYIDNFQKKDNSTYAIQGALVKIDTEPMFYAKIFNNLLGR